MPRTTALTLIAVSLLSLATAYVAAAQPPQTSPDGCGDCDALARALADVEKAASETRAKLPDVERRIQTLTADFDSSQRARSALQAKAQAGDADAQARLKSYDSFMGETAREIDGLRRERQALNEQLGREMDRAARFRAALVDCQKPCHPPPAGGAGGDANTTKCTACPQFEGRLRAIQDELSTLRDRLDNIRSQQATLGRSILRSLTEIARHAADVATGSNPGAADALGRAKSQLQDASGQLDRLNKAFRATVDEEWRKQLEAMREGVERDRCRRMCPDAHTSRTNSTGDSTTGTQTATAPAACHDCPKLAADLMAKQDRLNKLQEDLTEELLRMAVKGLEVSGVLAEVRNADPSVGGIQPADLVEEELREFNSATTRLQGEISKQAAEVEAAREALEKCDDKCTPPTTPISRSYLKPLMIAAGGGAIAVGAVLAGGGSPPVTTTGQVPSAPPAAPTAQQPTPAPPPPAPPQPSCTAFSGTYPFAGTLRMPRSCFFTGTVPYFTSPISGSFVLQLDAACSGTLTTRHPNTWTFMHRVTGVLNGSTLQLRSSGSFSSTQPFGAPFSSTVELTMANNTYSGTETHTSGSCTDIYDLRDNR